MKIFFGMLQESGWSAVLRRAVTVFLCGFVLLYATLLIVDPYDTLPFSPPLDRWPAASNQRFSYPAVAMKPEFDSIVVGTSVVRLLKPSELEAALGGRFANLAMNSAMPFEQSEILKLFARFHDDVKTVIVGIDSVWCEPKGSPKLTFRPFPPWLYDGNRWNDALHLLNLAAVEDAGRQVGQMIGLRRPRYQRNGYGNFLPSNSEYDLQKARNTIYANGARQITEPMTPPADNYAEYRRNLAFADMALMRDMLTALPRGTRKIFLGAPVHAMAFGPPGSNSEASWNECLRRIAEIGEEFGNSYVFDFRIRSEITMEDSNYWDLLHYGTDTASRIARLIGDGVEAGRSTDPVYRYVTP